MVKYFIALVIILLCESFCRKRAEYFFLSFWELGASCSGWGVYSPHSVAFFMHKSRTAPSIVGLVEHRKGATENEYYC